MLEGGKEFPTVALFLSQLSSEKPHNNRIHLNAQSRGVFRFLPFQYKTSLLPGIHWLLAQVMRRRTFDLIKREMSNDQKFDPPKASAGDAVLAVARAGLGTIPIAGAAAIELLTAIITPPLAKRRDEWMRRVGESLRQLEKQMNIILESLQSNDSFIDAAMQATQAALRTNQGEKLDALRNAVLNAALPNPPEEAIQQLFLNFVDSLTVWHLKILNFIYKPPVGGVRLRTDYTHVYFSELPRSIEETFSELSGRYPLYNQIIQDLSARGLLDLGAMDTSHEMATMQGIPSVKITDLGKEFIDFITSPLEEEHPSSNKEA
jgi:hypothetical protein